VLRSAECSNMAPAGLSRPTSCRTGMSCAELPLCLPSRMSCMVAGPPALTTGGQTPLTWCSLTCPAQRSSLQLSPSCRSDTDWAVLTRHTAASHHLRHEKVTATPQHPTISLCRKAGARSRRGMAVIQTHTNVTSTYQEFVPCRPAHP